MRRKEREDDAHRDIPVARVAPGCISRFQAAARNTREHKRRGNGPIAYMPLNVAPLSQFANLPRLKRSLPKNRE